jgi:simple sugar transport system ATP-binding protein
VTVRYGSFTALSDVTADFATGQIHAVVGQNGAGKTTFARALMGLVKPESGSVEILGENVTGLGVSAARSAGLDMVHQAFTLPPSMTVAEAMEFYVPMRGRFTLYRKRDLEAKCEQRLAEVGVHVDPSAIVGSLPVETLQSLEIGRALLSRARTLILDEPTASLAPQAAADLFERLRALADSGITILIVLHKVQEVLGVSDTVTVLRNGECVVAGIPTRDLDAASLSRHIIGDQVISSGHVTPELDRVPASGHALAIEEATTARLPGDAGLDGASLRVGAGEILGVAGVEGNGQRSLVEAAMGLVPLESGRIRLADQDVTTAGVDRRRRLGLRVIPFERLTEGVSSTRTLWENVSVGALVNRPRPARLLWPRRMRADATAALDRWQVRYQDTDQTVGELSGGNIQRLIFAREVDDSTVMLIAAQPTRGLDIGATAFVHQTLRDLRDNGAGVLLVSADLDELMALSDRIAVVRSGSIVGTFEPSYDRGTIGAAMVGAT